MGAIATAARRWLRTIRHLPDRRLHPFRRRAALARLRRRGVPRSILVVCYGNICRSPYAAERLRSLLGRSDGGVRVVSVGLYESGRPPPEEALAVASERGIEMAGHRSRLISDAVLHDSDLVIAVTAAHARLLRRRFRRRSGMLLLGDLDPRPIDTRAIRDPVDQPADVFRDVYARIDRCVEELVGALETGGRAGAEV
jgi:protein-tyrosine-phosphatase